LVKLTRTIAIENFKETDFLNSFELKRRNDLNIRVFLDKSLTNYHLLSPQSTADELTKTELSIYLLLTAKIYVENLNIGAGSASKNQKTFFRVPLISSTNEDSWEDFFGIDFLPMADKKYFQKENQLKIEIRPYLN
jgi:hypothetical protein